MKIFRTTCSFSKNVMLFSLALIFLLKQALFRNSLFIPYLMLWFLFVELLHYCCVTLYGFVHKLGCVHIPVEGLSYYEVQNHL